MYPIHSHGAWLNADGTGNTDVDSGHYHVVKEFRVQADPSDGHTHQITTLPCGAGAARWTHRGDALAPYNGNELRGGPTEIQLMGPDTRRALWIGLGIAVAGALVVGGIMYYRHSHEYDE